MTIFWILCALLLLVALLFIMVPLWRSKSGGNAVLRNAANLEILRDQIAEMDTDVRNGLLTPELYEQGKQELQARLLDEVKDDQQDGAKRSPHKILAIAIAVVLPLVSFGVYWKVGSPGLLNPQESLASMSGSASSPESVHALEQKVAENPNDGESLLLLARSYAEQERFADAAKAYEKLTRFVTDEAWIWADYADALAMAHGQSLVGEPTKLIDKALALEPNNTKALALAGSAAMERGDYQAAIRHWERLLKGLPADGEDAKMIENGLHQAREFLAQSKGGKAGMPAMAAAPESNEMPQGGAAGHEAISGTIVLSDALKSRVEPGDTVFVLARAAQGPKMPLAILRKQVSDLPLRFTLDDSLSMAPQMKLSNFDAVIVMARISKSGNAMPEPGDMQGVTGIIKPGRSGLKITIDSLVK